MHILCRHWLGEHPCAHEQSQLIGMSNQRRKATALRPLVLWVLLRLHFRRRSPVWSSIGPSNRGRIVLYCCHITQRYTSAFDAVHRAPHASCFITHVCVFNAYSIPMQLCGFMHLAAHIRAFTHVTCTGRSWDNEPGYIPACQRP